MELSIKFALKATISGVVNTTLPDTLTLDKVSANIDNKLSELLKNILSDGIHDVKVHVKEVSERTICVLSPIPESTAPDMCLTCHCSTDHCMCEPYDDPKPISDPSERELGICSNCGCDESSCRCIEYRGDVNCECDKVGCKYVGPK